VTEVIKSFGYRCKTFSCPSHYCEYAKSSHYNLPDIIITDVKMPKINGYQLMEAISELHKNIKFIVMTGFQGTAETDSKHPHVFIRKPFNIEELGDHIQKLLATT